MARLMVSSDMEDNLTFMTFRQLGRMTKSYFVERCILLFELFESSFRNVGDGGDFRQGMLATFHQPQCLASALRSPDGSLHNVIDKL